MITFLITIIYGVIKFQKFIEKHREFIQFYRKYHYFYILHPSPFHERTAPALGDKTRARSKVYAFVGVSNFPEEGGVRKRPPAFFRERRLHARLITASHEKASSPSGSIPNHAGESFSRVARTITEYGFSWSTAIAGKCGVKADWRRESLPLEEVVEKGPRREKICLCVGRTYVSDIHATLLFFTYYKGRMYAVPTLPSASRNPVAVIAGFFNGPLRVWLSGGKARR